MNIISKRLVDRYPNAIETYGYITKQNRFEAKLPKRHYIDACIIANGGPDVNFKSDIVYIKRSVTKGDYKQTKGERSETRMNRGKINGFRRYDKVQYKGNINTRKSGICSCGSSVIPARMNSVTTVLFFMGVICEVCEWPIAMRKEELVSSIVRAIIMSNKYLV